MQKKSAVNRMMHFAQKLAARNVFFLSLLCQLSLLSAFSPSVQAEYKIVYSDPSSHHKQADYSDDTNIWTLLQHEFTLNHHAERREVKEQIAWYMEHRKYLRLAANNARPYMYYIITQVKKRELPLEFALLPFNESAYDPFAYSTSGASGLWQMMPATATDFGLKQNWWYDGRRDVVASTNAALDYLVYLQNFFGGNWMFTIAAYHAGQGTVLNAVKKNAANGEATDFWSLPLGKQTQIYIPKLLALAEMIQHPEKYPLDLPPIPNKPYLTQVDVGSQIDLTKAAKLSGLSLSELKNLNPGFNRWATSPEGPYTLLVPIQNEAQLEEGLALLSKDKRVTWQRYDVQSGDTLSKIAAKFHTTMSILQQVNKLDTTVIHVGDVIFIPNPVARNSAVVEKSTQLESAPLTISRSLPVASSSDSSKSAASSSSPVAIYIVHKGDTLSSIAQTLNISWKTLRDYNHLTSNNLRLGQKLNIPPLSMTTKKSNQGATQKIRYIVQKGDTLEKIARRFDVTVKNIEAWNSDLTAHSVLHPGQSLLIYQSVVE